MWAASSTTFPATCRAAIITETADTEDEIVSLAVLNPSGLFFDQAIYHDEDGKVGGTWHWPERVEG